MRYCPRCGGPVRDENGKRTHRAPLGLKSPVSLPLVCPTVTTSHGTQCRPELRAGLEERRAA